LHPHDIYNLREATYRQMGGGAIHLIEGVLRADSPEAYRSNRKWPDLPLRILVLASYTGADFHWINAELFRRIQAGESLLDLDFTRMSASLSGN
jgi:hypothetical protein